MKFDDFVNSLTQENLDEITREFNKLKNKKPIYTFSKIELRNLKQLFDIDRNFNHKVFNTWATHLTRDTQYSDIMRRCGFSRTVQINLHLHYELCPVLSW